MKTLFYSSQAAQVHGTFTGTLRGKSVTYTAIDDPEYYLWIDKEVVGEFSDDADFQFVSSHPAPISFPFL